jgi:transposase
MKLSHSRMPFVRVYFRETQELVFDAHDKAFRFYDGVCRRGIYDNMNHLIEPVACTPASGWEKGQVENQVGNLRDQMFRPKPRVKSLIELNAWLEDQCFRADEQLLWHCPFCQDARLGKTLIQCRFSRAFS